MKFLTFNYTDSKGKESSRMVVQLSAPQPNHFCVDVGELEPCDMFSIQEELVQLESTYKEQRDAILAKYDVATMYRYFKPTSMTNLTEEE